MKKFPAYASVNAAASKGCFKCSAKLSPATAVDSGFPPGRGQMSMQCGGCRLFTFFDVRAK